MSLGALSGKVALISGASKGTISPLAVHSPICSYKESSTDRNLHYLRHR